MKAVIIEALTEAFIVIGLVFSAVTHNTFMIGWWIIVFIIQRIKTIVNVTGRLK